MGFTHLTLLPNQLEEAHMNNTCQPRIDKFRKVMADNNLDTFLIANSHNRRYLSGFMGEDGGIEESAGFLIISQDKLVLTTDSRYTTQARDEAPLYDIVEYKVGLAKQLPEILADFNTRRLGFEGRRLSFVQYNDIQKELKEKGFSIELISAGQTTENIRVVKDQIEIDYTKKALAYAEEALVKLMEEIKPGMTEKEVAWRFECLMRQNGAGRLSFPVICASGPNSALPHAIPTNRQIQKDDPIVFDWGVRYKGYCSDTTRTVVFGKPGDELKKVHQTVRDAQQKATEAIKAGADGKAVDKIARDYIDSQGYKDRFGHGLGHGTGLAIHEAPRLSPLSTSILEPGMIVTVEPGIYIPDWGGVRVENQVVVREDGAEILNSLSTTIGFDAN